MSFKNIGKAATASLLVALAVFVSAVLGEEVITLTTSNFKQAIDSNPYILVEFYAPWCGHCKKLAPEYEKAAGEAKNLDPKVVLAKVDATVEKDLATEYGVKGFPTLKWFVNGEVSDYQGGRDKAGIVQWVKKKTGPPAKDIKDAAAVEAFKKEADAVVLGLFKSESEAEGYIAAAKEDDETPYGICKENCEEVAKAAGVDASSLPTVVVLQNFDDGKAVYTENLSDKAALKKFIGGNILPLVIPFNMQTAPKIFGGDVDGQLLTFTKSLDDEEAKKITEQLRPVSKENRGKYKFVIVPMTETRIVEFFGINEDEVPAVRIVKMGEGVKKYKYTETEITTENIKKFLADYEAGKVPVDLKSAEPLAESEQGPVRVVVGKDFEKVISEPGKDVLVEFYAPWCGHCKKLEPEYTALGEHFKDNANIVIAKMDATANEVEKVQVSGFPTIKFFPADSDEIVDYDGARDKNGFIKFLEEKAVSLKK